MYASTLLCDDYSCVSYTCFINTYRKHYSNYMDLAKSTYNTLQRFIRVLYHSINNMKYFAAKQYFGDTKIYLPFSTAFSGPLSLSEEVACKTALCKSGSLHS